MLNVMLGVDPRSSAIMVPALAQARYRYVSRVRSLDVVSLPRGASFASCLLFCLLVGCLRVGCLFGFIFVE
jgi:hypothetical protein